MDLDFDLNTIHKQITYNMRKAWCRKIEEDITKNPPNFDFIINLYKEIKDRILYIVKKNTLNYKDIDDSLDIEIFKQMIMNDVFNRDSFKNLVYYLFQCCIKLGSADRDKDVIRKRDELISQIDTCDDIFKVIATFFLEINTSIDIIYEDIHKFFKSTS